MQGAALSIEDPAYSRSVLYQRVLNYNGTLRRVRIRVLDREDPPQEGSVIILEGGPSKYRSLCFSNVNNTTLLS